MSVSTALGLVSASLRNLLVGEMRLSPTVPVTIMAPDEPGGDQRINLFLYKIEENAFLKNEDGPTAVEYAVMLALIIVVCIAAITTLGGNVNNTFSYIAGFAAPTGS